MTISDFVKSIDETTPENILIQASPEELKSFGCQVRVGVQLWKTLHGAKVEGVAADENVLLLTLSKDGKVYRIDRCKGGVTLSELIPPEPLTNSNLNQYALEKKKISAIIELERR